jgi:uncharacterized membrane protein
MVLANVHTSGIVLVVAVFLACAVEMVEAFTIVLAVATTRGWRSAAQGSVAALVVLAALVAVFGPALTRIPLDVLRVGIGAVLLIFGLQWLRKAVLRAAGLKAKHDEDAIYAEQVAELEAADDRDRDRVAFVVAFKGVFLEGLEVVVIVLTLGATGHDLGLAAVAAGAALVVVSVVAAVVARQLSGVPENAMKAVVGLMLVGFGTFWAGEGLGVRWPGSDLMIPVLVAAYGLWSWLLVSALRRAGRRVAPTAVGPGG